MEVYRSSAIKINNAEGTNPKVVNGQRIKHYISGMPINVENNVIQTMASEEHIKETFQNSPEPRKVRDKWYGKQTVSKKYTKIFSVSFGILQKLGK